ncbi:universal stress protein [Amycolatopsis suaedae]|uniref:Universal stress protein n=1 Tax=Amycolatopsis suaedae TaxID=2510978 RepID=A0A4Q7JB97_9PSEU|nr:universal stress protein [Amycolatopsis suaedae]RZQ64559.1 universal stress protein [Amycolatopsis suaedae]
MSDSTRGPVIAGFDGSPRARQATRWAATEARHRQQPLLIVHCFQWAPPIMDGWTGASTADGEQIRAHSAEQLREVAESCAVPGLDVETHLVEGQAKSLLPALGEELAAELLVVGATGLGALPRALLGSTAAHLVRTARPPVIVVRGDDAAPASGGPVVVGVDGSPTSDRALDFAFDCAARWNTSVHAVHAWNELPLGTFTPMPAGEVDLDRGEAVREQAVRELLDGWAVRYPEVRVDFTAADDRPAHALIEVARPAKLLVVGSHGRGPVRRAFLGSVSHALLHHAPCPLAVLRHTDE